MPKSRLELHELLCELLGSRNVYFQSPPSVQMKYPCIIYKLDDIDAYEADNTKYLLNKRYSITYVDKNPDAPFPERLLELPYCSLDRSYPADNLNHWVFTLYY